MKETSYAGRESRDDIKKDPNYTRLNPDAKKAADKELEKGGIVDLGEDTLDEMEFFSVAVSVPDELPRPERIYSNLESEANTLVDSSYIDTSSREEGTIIVTFMRKADANNFMSFASSQGIPEEYIDEPESREDVEAEEELFEIVMDSVGNELFVNDILRVSGRTFKIAENKSGTVSLFNLEGKEVIPISDPRAHIILRHSIKENLSTDYDAGDLDIGHVDDEPDMLKAYVYDIIDYGIKLYKQLNAYGQLEREVDFPNWWQAKIIKAKDYISSAQHYLEFEEKQPALDAMALESQVNERSGDLEHIIHDIRMHGEESDDVQGTAAEYIFYIASAFDINLNNINDYLSENQVNERSSVLDNVINNIRVHGEESGDIQGTAAEYIFYIANAFDINLNNIKDYL